MDERVILGEIKKQQTILQVSDSDLMRITGWSRQTLKRRFDNPRTIRVGELTTICNYLNIKSI